MPFKAQIGFWLVPLVTSVLTAFLIRNAKSNATVVGARNVLVYGWVLKAIGYLFVGGWLAAGVWIYAVTNRDDVIFVAAFFCLLAIASSIFLFEAYCVRIEYDNSHIYCFSPYRKNRVIPWSAIYKVTYSESGRMYIMRTRNQGTIRVSEYMAGINDFLVELRNRGFRKDA